MDKINWREAFERFLAGGGITDGSNCIFCWEFPGDNCSSCPASCLPQSTCTAIFVYSMESSERRAICRHVLSTVEDFTDVSEIRTRIAEMLDDEAREKFLGPEYIAMPNDVPGHGFTRPYAKEPELLHYITRNIRMKLSQSIIAAFRDEDTRDRVLEILNREEK